MGRSQQKQANANLKSRLKSFTQQPVGASSSRQQRASFKMQKAPSAAVACEDDEAALKTNMKIPKCADIRGFCTDTTNGQHARKYCQKTCGVCSKAASTKSCRDPHRTDPESWECECHEQMVAACPATVSDKARNFLKTVSGRLLGDLKSFDSRCYRMRLCHNPTVCKSWKDKACPVAEIKQFTEDEALFSAWAKEHRARAAGKTNEELDISATTAGSALDKDLSDNTALHTAAASSWTLTPTIPRWTLTPTADQSCFAD